MADVAVPVAVPIFPIRLIQPLKSTIPQEPVVTTTGTGHGPTPETSSLDAVITMPW